MAVYIVTYDLHKSGQNYKCISEKLEEYGTHWHIQGSVWIIETAKSAEKIRDELLDCLDDNDKLLVTRLHGEAAWFGHSDSNSKWLQGRLKPLLR